MINKKVSKKGGRKGVKQKNKVGLHELKHLE